MKDTTGRYAGGLYGLALLCLMSGIVCVLFLDIPDAAKMQRQTAGSLAD